MTMHCSTALGELGRVLFTQDADLLAEAHRRQRLAIPFAGVIYGHQLELTVGHCLHDLEIIAKAGDPSDMIGRVQYLPL